MTKSQLATHIDSLVRSLPADLSACAISKIISSNKVRGSKGSKSLRSAVLVVLQTYKAKGNYGYLATGLVMGILVEGHDLLSDVEAKGVLLCGETVEAKFYDMLKRLKSCLSGFSGNGPVMANRVETYINFCDLTAMVAERIARLKRGLRTRSHSLT